MSNAIAADLDALHKIMSRIKSGQSYFSSCERDDEGNCLPKGETSDAPSPEQGNSDQFAAIHEHAEKKASALVRFIKDIPAKVYDTAKAKVSGAYQKLAARYGKPMALAVVGAGIAGAAVPVPGAALVAAAPLIAAGELYLRLRGVMTKDFAGFLQRAMRPVETKAAPAVWVASQDADLSEFMAGKTFGRVFVGTKSDSSYFASCPRDEGGHCLPSGESDRHAERDEAGVGKKPRSAKVGEMVFWRSVDGELRVGTLQDIDNGTAVVKSPDGAEQGVRIEPGKELQSAQQALHMSAEQWADANAPRFEAMRPGRPPSFARDAAKKEHAQIISELALAGVPLPKARKEEYPFFDVEAMQSESADAAAKLERQRAEKERLREARANRKRKLEELLNGDKKERDKHDAIASQMTLADYLRDRGFSQRTIDRILAAQIGAGGRRIDPKTGSTLVVPGGSSAYLAHYNAVKRLLEEGREILPSVLAEYPELAAKYGKSYTPITISPALRPGHRTEHPAVFEERCRSFLAAAIEEAHDAGHDILIIAPTENLRVTKAWGQRRRAGVLRIDANGETWQELPAKSVSDLIQKTATPATTPDKLIALPDIRQPDDFSCILPGQELQGQVIGGSKAWYTGEAVKIRTARGSLLSVTTNHPVLTMMGFVAAGQLEKGQSLLNYIGEDKSTLSGDDKQNAPAIVEEVFCALQNITGSILAPEKVSPGTFDFHGDAQFFKGQIEVVGSYRQLRADVVANGSQCLSQRAFVGSNMRLIAEDSGRSFDFGFQGSCTPLGGLMGGDGLLHSRLGTHPAPDDFSGITPATQCQSMISECTREKASAECAVSCQLLEGCTAFVEPDQLIEVGDFRANDLPLFGSGQHLNAFISKTSGNGLPANTDFGCQFVDSGPLLEVPANQFGNVGNEYCLVDSDGISLGHTSQQDASRMKRVSEALRTDAGLFCQRLESDPAVIHFDQLIQVDDVAVSFLDCIAECLVSSGAVNAPLTQGLRFGSAAHLDATMPKSVPHGVHADVVLAGQLAQRCSGDIVLDEIIDIERFHYDGPVYDFESPHGYIIVGNLCISNCGRCVTESVGRYFGVGPKTDTEWEQALGTNRRTSTHPFAIRDYLESLGLRVEARDGMTLDDLRDYWRRGMPVICPIQEWGNAVEEDKHSDQPKYGPPAQFPYGHWIAVVGLGFGKVVVQDPSIDNVLDGEHADASKGLMLIDEDEFLRVWHDRDAEDNQFVRYGIAVGPKVGAETKAWDESKHPRGQPENAGEFAPASGGGKKPKPTAKPSAKPAAVEASSHPGAAHGSSVKIKTSKQRAWNEEPATLETTLTKQETGRVGEAIALAWLRQEFSADARPMNTDKTNFPIDLIEDHAPTEVKAGLASNSRKAEQWRLTFSKESAKEKELYEKMTPEERTKWNAEKQKRIHERKKKVIAELEKHYKKKVKPRTLTLIINPDTKTADIFLFDGFHDRIDWRSKAAKASYKGTVSYAAIG